MKSSIHLSVHQLVDFLLRTGDIDNRVFNRSTMNEGSKIHSVYQESQNNDYYAEYPLKRCFVVNEIEVILEGRADGIIKRKTGEYVIDEIKTTIMDLTQFKDDNLSWHLGQAKCYALMFALEQNIEYIGIKLTYIKQGKDKEKLIDNYSFQVAELDQFVHTLIEEYLQFYNLILRLQEKRNASIKVLNFPFEGYRKGQKELIKYSYGVAKKGGVFFCEAPTGIGKTMSTLFPFIKAIEEDKEAKIFYLTAKTSGKESAFNAIELLKENNLYINDIIITAKEKICNCPNKECNPDSCPFAKGYYNKIQSVLSYALNNYSTFSFDTVKELSYEFDICPFELELDLSLFCDVIICDYNYLFDPIAYFKRYFDTDASHFLALIDECHNLVDRSKEMYSSFLSKKTLLAAKYSIRKIKNLRLKRQLTKLKNIFDDIELKYENGNHIIANIPDEYYHTLMRFTDFYLDFFKDEKDLLTNEIKDLYLEINHFLKISEFVNEKYVQYFFVTEDDVLIRLYCLDASGFLRRSIAQIKGAVYFSATLSPLEYYIDTLGGDVVEDPSLLLPSPFPRNNFKLLIAPKVSLKYKNRETSYEIVADYIKSFILSKLGNYFVFVPSYSYLEKIKEYLDVIDIDLQVQEKDMSEKDKELFLSNFKNNPTKTTVGLIVVGGSFGEGIDLMADRLIGAVVVGIGLPKINFESDCIKDYFISQDKPGYEYAYLYPGMNKVMQAVGRVIRSENDKGAVLLIDERYLYKNYLSLFKNEWSSYKVVFTPNEVSAALEKFFK